MSGADNTPAVPVENANPFAGVVAERKAAMGQSTEGPSDGESIAAAVAPDVDPGEGSAEGAEGAEGAKDWPEPPKPKERVTSIADRFKKKANTLEEQLEQERLARAQLEAKLNDVTAKEQKANEEFTKLIEAGDIDGALKVRGLSTSFDDLQKRYLQQQGALPTVEDPKVAKLEIELQEFKRKEAEQRQAYEQRQEQARKQQAYLDATAQIKKEVAELDFPGAKELTEVTGFADLTLKVLASSQEELTVAEAATISRGSFKEVYEQLHKVFGPREPKNPEKSGPAPSNAEATLSQSKAGDVSAPTDGMSFEERRAAVIAKFAAAKDK